MKTKLQEMRKKAGYKSAREFAESIGMNVGTYTNYEQGQRDLSVAVAWQLADALDCSLDELAGRDFRPEARPALTEEEGTLLDAYRMTSRDRRRDLVEIARVLSRGETAQSSPGRIEVA